MTVVTVSRMLGTTGDAIAASVATALGSRLVNRATLHAAAQAVGIPLTTLSMIEGEGVSSLVERLIFAVRRMPTLPRSRGGSLLDAAPMPMAHEGFLPETPTQTEVDQSARLMEKVIRNLAAEGSVVIVGRAGHAILRGQPGALHVQVVAPLEERITAVAEAERLDRRNALARIRASDRAKADFVRRYYNLLWTDSALYHLVINSALIPVSTATHLVVSAVQSTQPS